MANKKIDTESRKKKKMKKMRIYPQCQSVAEEEQTTNHDEVEPRQRSNGEGDDKAELVVPLALVRTQRDGPQTERAVG